MLLIFTATLLFFFFFVSEFMTELSLGTSVTVSEVQRTSEVQTRDISIHAPLRKLKVLNLSNIKSVFLTFLKF